MRAHGKAAVCCQSQGGAVLVLALVFLLLMATMGVGSLDSARLALRMVNNDQQRVRAFYQAELALLQAEQALEAWAHKPEGFDFDRTDDAVFKAGKTLMDYEQWQMTDTRSPYFIEYLGPRVKPGGETLYLYRIVARGDPSLGGGQSIASVYAAKPLP